MNTMTPIQSEIDGFLRGGISAGKITSAYGPEEIGQALGSAFEISTDALVEGLYAVADEYIARKEFEKGAAFIKSVLESGLSQAGVEAEAWLLGSEFHSYANRFTEALRHIENAKNIFHSAGDTEKLLRTYTDAAYFLIRSGDFGRARQEASTGLALAETGDYAKWRMRLLTNLGLALKEIGDELAAIDVFRKSIDLAKRLDNPRVIAVNLVNIGNLYGRIGRLEQAVDFMRRAKVAWDEIGDRREVARCLNNLANLLLDTKPDKALEFLDECLEITQDGGFADVESAARHNKGLLRKREGRNEDAAYEFELSRRLSRETGDDDGLWRAEQQLGRLLVENGDAAAAKKTLEDAANVLTGTRKGLVSDLDRVRFLADRESLFVDLVSTDLALGDMKQGVADIQRVKGIALYELMTGGSAAAIDKRELEGLVSPLREKRLVVLDYFLLPDRIVAGVIIDKGIFVSEARFDLEELKNALAGLQDKIKAYEISGELRSKPDQRDTILDQILKRLYEMVMGFIDVVLDRAVHLAIIPHGDLGRVPFAALKDDDSYLVEKSPISIFPNLAAVKVFLTSEERKLDDYSLTFVRGDSSDLEGIDAELAAVSEGFPGTVAESGIDGLESLAGAGGDWLHYAGHAAFVPGKQSEPFIETYAGNRIPFILPGEHAPDVSVLSACQTGLGEMRGAGQMLGFARSMFAAGGRAMVAALWQVDDKCTRELMGELYMSLKKTRNMSGALAAAQRKAIERKWHPYFWAGFSCNGDASFT